MAFQQADIHLTQRHQPPSLNVQADPTGLEQVIVNLLLNALEACHQQQAGHVQLSMERDDHRYVLLHVDDQGPGVPNDQQDAVFTPFYSTRKEGLGMGLAISRSLMEAMGGALTLSHSPLFCGARFSAKLRSA